MRLEFRLPKQTYFSSPRFSAALDLVPDVLPARICSAQFGGCFVVTYPCIRHRQVGPASCHPRREQEALQSRSTLTTFRLESTAAFFQSHSKQHEREQTNMSLATATRTCYHAPNTIATTTQGVVQTGTIASVLLEAVTGMPFITTVTASLCTPSLTTIGGTPQVVNFGTTTTTR